MKTSLFDFDLPEQQIASKPASPRDSARLLHVGKTLSDHIIRALPALLHPGDLMVFNNTKVIPARLFGKRGGVSVEVTLHKHVEGLTWKVFAKPGKRLRESDTVIFAEDFTATVKAKEDTGEVVLTFNCAPAEFEQKLVAHGHMPLPPYIAREDNAHDLEDYQTIFARHPGAVAAPTAGLHFTHELLRGIDDAGIGRCAITLHVGGGTFLPVKSDDTDAHKMHSEIFTIPEDTALRINAAKAEGRRIVAVGTTSLRALEAAADSKGHLKKFTGETDIFITPGYRFKVVDALLTNFHLPRSTLFMLVSAFAGLERMHAAYKHAMEAGYRFYSYGDACLLEKNDQP